MNKKVDFDEYLDNYNSLLSEATGFFSSSEEYFASYKVDIVKKLVADCAGNILEYGCGIGRNLPYLQNIYPAAKLFGSDIATASLELASKKNPNVIFFTEDGNSNQTEKFDLIFVAGVFHHVPLVDRNHIGKVLFNRLKPEGVLVVFEHNPFNPITRKIVNDCPYDEDAVLLRPKELKNILSLAGLVNISSSYCLFFPPRLKKLVKLENILYWLPLGGQYFVEASKPR